jgi:hypothetical protein
MANTHEIQIVKRPWYEWLIWGIWFVALVFIAQNAITSSQELEPTAAMLFWMMFGVLFIGGAIIWFIRRSRLVAKVEE